MRKGGYRNDDTEVDVGQIVLRRWYVLVVMVVLLFGIFEGGVNGQTTQVRGSLERIVRIPIAPAEAGGIGSRRSLERLVVGRKNTPDPEIASGSSLVPSASSSSSVAPPFRFISTTVASTAAAAASGKGDSLSTKQTTTIVVKAPAASSSSSSKSKKWTEFDYIIYGGIALMVVFLLFVFCSWKKLKACVAFTEEFIAKIVRVIFFPFKLLIEAIKMCFYPIKNVFWNIRHSCYLYCYPYERTKVVEYR